MGAMSPWHWAVVLLVLVLLFGSAKLPGAARGLGRSLRIFKSEIQEMQSDGKPSAETTETARELPTAPQPSPDPADQATRSDKKTA
ncbi:MULTISPECIES: Sec-independent protein translocase subunit TatA [Gordonia]|uniref:Sec-independent protein translocase protein TatA n=2 Tax=Gordonia TaxID=2053 RepID=L7LEX5_9ACTN|nr:MULTISPECIES: Sec-independent protein translocase subunit TatA [Gordonia]AUH69014.1 twin-arginine translocase TatA/TatE family subunit [Gordonia sp. YC-JH1]KXT56776.1 preprotein translocase subunit TatA [Gordonia sp. QH-12]MBY4568546.1 Sec-independent protein translocase TatA [Gordonia sihwensis]WFN94726.1 Sec-independent protein translocase subunit TatA [Gordonia sihwensis]GAC59680.1 Sec-independent protein translocase protein TatA [Gordonia sihwensis NBRC 108236]